MHRTLRTLLSRAPGTRDRFTDLDIRHVASHYDAEALLLAVDPREGLRERAFGRPERWAHNL